MLSQTLYDLSLFLLCPYNQLSSNLFNLPTLDENILEDLYCKKLFNHKWRKILNSPIEQIDPKYSYNVIDQNSNFVKVKFTIQKSFVLKNSLNNITSCCIDKYLVIMEHIHSNFKVLLLINKEENPSLYKLVLTSDLNKINTLLSSKVQSLWNTKIDNINSIYENFLSYAPCYKKNNINERNSNFNVLAACDYAEKFALTSNPAYKTYEGTGGDCTNFVSQIIHAGGINLSDTWKPYNNPWIRVNDLYWYLTFQGIGIKIPEEYPLSKGCVIQFYTPKKGTFFHTGFITYELENGDYLYCCHSYNKLNYPLSEIYPIIYPKLRAVKLR